MQKLPRPYADNWRQKSRKTRKAAKDCCVACFKCKATQTHHLRYHDYLGAIYGREIPGWDIVPVCRRCHTRLHHPSRYRYYQKRDHNHQRWAIALRLSFKFWLWACFANTWPVWSAILLAWYFGF